MRRTCFVLALAAAVAASAAGRPASAPAEDDDTQDLVYLGRPHPALLRLRLRVDGQSTFARWDVFLESFFKFLDRNKSGGLDRAEAARAPLAAQMSAYYIGNPFTFTARQGAGLANSPFAAMDADRDGKVTLDELKDYYLKNGAGPVALAGATPVPARGGVAPPAAAAPRADALFELLDVNKDGKLSRAELDAALKSLAKYDVNDDELVSLAEMNLGVQGTAFARLQAAEEALRAQARGAALTQAAPAELMLIPREPGVRASGRMDVARDLVARLDRDKDGKLSRDELPLPKADFDALKPPRDGKLTALKVRRWLESKPVGEVAIKVGVAAARGGLLKTPPSDGRTFTLEGVRIKVVSAGVGGRASYKQYLTNVFKQIDSDKRGYITRKDLDEPQYAFMRGLFDFADRNADNRLTEAELKELLELMEKGQGAQLVLTLSPSGQGLFQALDSNADGNLSVRELRSAWARMAAMDKDGDGAISRGEFPRQFLLNVTQGPTYGFAPQDAYADPSAGSRASGPLWFRKMDRNGDGDLSRLEWLGTKEDFAEADGDGDGLISAAEAEAYDAKRRQRPAARERGR